MSESEDEHQRRLDEIAARKRFNMKSLGRQVDANRLTGITRPEVLEENLPHRSTRGSHLTVDVPVDDVPEERTVDEAVDTVDEDVDTVDEAVDTDELVVDDVAGDELVEDDEAPAPIPEPIAVDRSNMGTSVTKSGLPSRLGDRVYEPITSGGNLARRMLDEEIQPGGRISDPRAVPGILLELAKDLPASVAVSVVRTDEEIELVGNTVDPSFESEAFATTFSSLFRSLQTASGAFRDGPFGKVRDVVIESDKMDLVLRSLGENYFLMVLENRTSPDADLEVTRRRMAMLAPGLSAILAIENGDA